MKPRYLGLLGIVLILFVGAPLGGYGSPEHDQPIRGLGGLASLIGIGLIVYAIVKHYKKDKSPKDNNPSD